MLKPKYVWFAIIWLMIGALTLTNYNNLRPYLEGQPVEPVIHQCLQMMPLDGEYTAPLSLQQTEYDLIMHSHIGSFHLQRISEGGNYMLNFTWWDNTKAPANEYRFTFFLYGNHSDVVMMSPAQAQLFQGLIDGTITPNGQCPS